MFNKNKKRSHKNYDELDLLMDSEAHTFTKPKKRFHWPRLFHRRQKITLGPVAAMPEQATDSIKKKAR